MSPESMPPNDYGSSPLVDECEQVNISNLLRIALFELKKTLIQSQLQAEGIEIGLLTSKTGFGGQRLWFECIACKRRVGTLYRNPTNNALGCRKCLGLRYRCSARKGMVEGGCGIMEYHSQKKENLYNELKSL